MPRNYRFPGYEEHSKTGGLQKKAQWFRPICAAEASSNRMLPCIESLDMVTS